MVRWNRLKRWVAPGLRSFAGGWRLRPDAGSRLQGLVALAGHDGRATMRELVTLAWPIAAAMLGEVALGLCDTKLVGALGAAALGGVGMAGMLLFLGYAMIFGLMRGVKVRTAYAVGEGRPGDAVRYAQAGALLGAAAGVAIWGVSRDVTPILRALHLEASMVPYARDFVAARSWGAVGTCAGAALIQYLQGVGDSRSPMVVGVAGNVVNAALAYSLIHGRFGLPALGVRGAGYATAATELLELAALVVAVRARARTSSPARITLGPALREVAGLGVPTGLHFVLESMAFMTFVAILGTFGAAQMAAHQIAMSTMRASFLPGVAVAEAASVLVARSLGERRLDEADRVTVASLALGLGFMTLCGVAFALFGEPLAAAFTDEPEVIRVARKLFLVAAVFQTLDAANMILRGALRGAKDVRWVAVVGTSVAWVAVPGSAFLLGRLAGWGAVGGWVGFVFETAVGSALLWRRWTRGPWRASFGEVDHDADCEDEDGPASTPALAG
jgi:multidrug resistance protein, MATE family